MASGGPKYTQHEEFHFNLARQRIRPRGIDVVSRRVDGKRVPSIHPSVFTDILDYFIPDRVRVELELPPNSRVLKLDQNKRAKHLKKIAALAPGSYYHIPTVETELPLPITIKRTRNGEFQLYVEIRNNIISRKFQKRPLGVFEMLEKSKTDNSILISGAIKEGGDTIRIDNEKVYFSLESSKPVFIERMQDAVMVTGIVGAGSENIDVYISGFFKGLTYCVYSQKATLSLHELLSRPEEFPLSENHILFMMRDLLYALECIHDKGLVHQDLKPDNILVTVEYGEPGKPETNSYKLKICDFDWVAVEGSKMRESVATADYQSPDILYAHWLLNGSYYKYFFEKYLNHIKKTIGYEMFKEKNCIDEHAQLLKPSAANDIFALGVIFAQLMGRSVEPVSLREIGCLKELSVLCDYRKSRPDIKQAIKIFHDLYPKIPPRPDKPKTSILQEKIDSALLYLVLEWGKMILQDRDGAEKATLLMVKENFKRHLLRLKRRMYSEEDRIEIGKSLDNLRSKVLKIDSDELTKKFLMEIDAVLIALKDKAYSEEEVAIEEKQSEKEEKVAAKKVQPEKEEDVMASVLTPLRDLRLAKPAEAGKPESGIFVYPKPTFVSIKPT